MKILNVNAPFFTKLNFKGRAEDSFFAEMAKGMFSQKNDSFEKEESDDDDFGSMMSSRDSVLKSFAVEETNDIDDVQPKNFNTLTDFTSTLKNLKIPNEESEFFVLLGAYERDRQYHNLEHLKNMLTNLNAYEDLTRQRIKNRDIFKLAIYYHDFVNGESNDVEKSANAAIKLLQKSKGKYASNNAALLKKLILATDHTKDLSNASFEEKLISDLDMAVLASTPKEYKDYTNKVRKEYKDKNYSSSEFDKGRSLFLAKMLDTGHIFYTPFFQLNYEAKARDNIKQELESLKARIAD